MTEPTSPPAGAAPPAARSFAALRHRGFPRPVHHLRAGDDGRQHRARDQLLDGVPEIPFAGARRLRRASRTGCRSCCSRWRRARWPTASTRAASSSVGMGLFIIGLARLGLFLHHRHAADVARHGAAGDPWLRRRAVADAEPDAALRHRRPGGSAERGAPERDRALSRRAGRPGGGRRDHARARAGARHPAQHASSTCRWCCGW